MTEPLQFALVRALQVQPGPGFHVDIDLGTLGGGAVGGFLTTLTIGAVMIAVVPEYTERTMESLVDEPIEATIYGLICLVGVAALAVLFVLTIVGVLVAIPLVLVTWLLWAIGSVVAYLAIAERLVGREDGWLKPLFVGAAINGGLLLTGVGSIVAFVIGAAGFGAVARRLD